MNEPQNQSHQLPNPQLHSAITSNETSTISEPSPMQTSQASKL